MAIAQGREGDVLNEADAAIVRFARRVAGDASRITAGEVAALKEIHGFSDAEVFDIATIAAARAFFTKVLDALGSEPDLGFMKVERELRQALTVGRPISHRSLERLDQEQARCA